jgi:hypothetical protein
MTLMTQIDLGVAAGTHSEEKPRSQKRDLGHPPVRQIRPSIETANKESRRAGTIPAGSQPARQTPKLRSAVQARSSSDACFAKQKRSTFSPRPGP